MKQIYEKNYSLEEISNMIAEYFERISDITNFKIKKLGNSYACIDTIFKEGKSIPRLRLISEYELFLLFQQVSKIPEDNIKYFHLSSIKHEVFSVGYNLVDTPRTRKH